MSKNKEAIREISRRDFIAGLLAVAFLDTTAEVAEAGSFRCNSFKGSDKTRCERVKRRIINRMRQNPGHFVRSESACRKSYLNFKRERPVWYKVRDYCVRNKNPRNSSYLKKLARKTGLYIPSDCVEACGVAEGKTWYYSTWKRICK